MWFLAEAFHSIAEFGVQVVEIAAAEVPQLDLLQVSPDALVGVEIGRVTGELLEMESPARACGEEVFDDPRPMDRIAVPDDAELSLDDAEEMPKEPHDVLGPEGMVLDVEEELPLERDRADRREVIARQVLSEDRRLACGREGSDDAREGIEPGFVGEEDRL